MSSPFEDDGPPLQVQGPVVVVLQVPPTVLQVWLLGHAPQLAPPAPQVLLFWLE